LTSADGQNELDSYNIILMTLIGYVLGAPIGSFVGGYMFKHIGSIDSFKLLSVVAFFTCVTQITVNYLINRLTINEDVKDRYSKVETKDDNLGEDLTLTS